MRFGGQPPSGGSYAGDASPTPQTGVYLIVRFERLRLRLFYRAVGRPAPWPPGEGSACGPPPQAASRPAPLKGELSPQVTEGWFSVINLKASAPRSRDGQDCSLQMICSLAANCFVLHQSKNHPCGQNNPATGVIFYLLFYFVHLTAYSMVTSVLSASASAGISASSGRTSTSKAAPHSAQTILSLSSRVSSSTMFTVPQLGQVTS